MRAARRARAPRPALAITLASALAASALASATPAAAQTPADSIPAAPPPRIVANALAPRPGVEPITLHQAIEKAQRDGLPARAAERARESARSGNRAFNSRLLPRMSLSATAPSYNRDIVAVVQPDGTTQFTSLQRTESSVTSRIDQPLPWTGGSLSISSSLNRLRFSGAQDQDTWTSAPVRVALSQDVLRPNTIRWEMREADLRLDAAERRFQESREEVAVQTANAYFDVFAARAALTNAENNAATNDTLYTLNKGRFEVGKIGENDLLQSELALLRSRAALDEARLNYDRAASQLRIALRLPAGAPVEVTAPADIPAFDPDTTVAVTQALRNGAQVADLSLQEVQARRRVTAARLDNGLNARVTASMGFNQTGPEMDAVYRDLREAQGFALGVEVPILQWGVRGAEVQAATADRQRVEATARLAREQTAQEAKYAALQLSQARRNVEISAKADTVAQKRFEVAYNRYIIGRIGIDNLYIAQGEKDAALLQYVQALRGYWNAYYRLRRLTLYDFEAGQVIR